MVGLFDALLTTVRIPVKFATALGVKLTLRSQIAPTASVPAALGHVPRATVNRAVEALTEIMVNAPGPLFLSRKVRVVVVLIRRRPKPSVAGIANTGTGAIPVPVRVTVCGEPGALLAMFSVAVFSPVVVGANRTLTVQLAPGTTVAHPFVCWN